MADTQTTEVATRVVEAVRFSFMTHDKVRKHSCLKVTSPLLFDNVDRPVPGGLYDPIMGPLDDLTPCESCGQLQLNCPGHCGHIELAYPVYHPLLFNFLHSLLQKTCFFCHHFRLERGKVERCVSQLKLIIKGDIAGAKLLNYESEILSSQLENIDLSHESGVPIDSLGKCENQEVAKQQWTSLQFTEANDVLNKFMKSRTAKCKRCNARNPSVQKPMFGWFHMGGMMESSIRANVLRQHMVSMPSEDFGDDRINAELEAEYTTEKKQRKDAVAVNSYLKVKNFSTRHLLPTEVKEIVKALWENEYEFCSFIGDLQHIGSEKVDYNMFFLESVLVPPTKFRAPTKGGDSVMEHPQTVSLNKVLQTNISLGNARVNSLGHSKVISRWMELQQSINVLFDSKTATAQAQRDTSGVCQLLDKKEGLFRQKMMGKRVNHACRSVISPDPYIAVNEIGIPPCFALKLTYPERVTPWNVEKLREAIINGPNILPGATHYSDKLSTMKLPLSRKARIAMARKLQSSRGRATEPGKDCEVDFEGKTVYRHMQDGDIVLVNRQPTLHKPSIMAHKVRVLKGEKTLRLHYANCSTYNADFDGDEMNVHFPQDEISRAEAYDIVNANNQYVRPSNGDPLRALIQDHIVSAVLLTKRDTFLDRDHFNQLLFSSGVSDMVISSFSGKSGKKVLVSASDAELLAVVPAILKPAPLWTGKQVITAVLNQITRGHPPFTVEKATKLSVDFFKCRSRGLKSKSTQNGGKEGGANESWKQELDENKLLVSKNDLVRGVIDKAQFADYGLVHTVQELYGSNTAGELLSVLSRLFTVFLQMHGFTCGVDDLIIKKDMDDKRTKHLEECELIGERVLRKAIGIGDGVQIDPMNLKFGIEKVICSGREAALSSLDRSIVNELYQSTSKGVMNDLLSDGLLKPSGKNCISLMTLSGAKGSKVNFQQISSHLGQQELEGKRVPRMVSGKTLPCFHPWDWSPRAGGFISDRFLSGLRPQEYYFHCMAGREGLVDTAVKTSRSGYLQRCLLKNLESLKVNYDYTVRDSDGSIIQFQYGEDGVDVHRASFIGKFKELTANQDMILQRCSEDALSESNYYITDLPISLKKQTEKFAETLSLNERAASKLVKQEKLLKLVKSKFFASLAQPGEPVGVLAAQSVGEPSTQMTLNTFHLAGRGEMNVTLGIPRLQEILMTASSNIKTPIMTCPLLKGKTKDDANDIANKLRKITLADVIEGMEVSVVPFAIHGDEGEVCSIQKLKMKLCKPEHFPRDMDITAKTLEETLKVVFVRELEDAIQKHVVLLSRMSGINNFTQEAKPKAGDGVDEDVSVGGKHGGEDDDDADNDDDGQDIDDLGSDAKKRKKQAVDEIDYEESSEEEYNEPSSVSGMEEDENMEIIKEDTVSDDSEEIKFSQARDAEKSKSEGVKAGHKIKWRNLKRRKVSMEPQPHREDNSYENMEITKEGAVGDDNDDKSKQEEAKAGKRIRSKKKKERNIGMEAKGMEFEISFKFTNEPHILLAQIAEKTAQKVNIQNSGKIERCNVTDCSDSQVIFYGENAKEREGVSNEEKKATPALNAAGIDFNALWELQDELDVRYLYSNSIQAMLNTYGVEAARETIIRETNNVFKSYGISVSTRHLSLIADYMTHSGGYRPMNRMGGIAESVSPFGRITFETASKCIVQASTYGEVDNLETPSSRISLGLPVKLGTGDFELMQSSEC